MASKAIYEKFIGRSGWAKVFDNYYDEYNGQKFWSFDLYLSDEELKKFQGTGLTLKPFGKGRNIKPLFDDGDTLGFRVRRPLKKLFGDTLAEFEPPRVTDANGDTLEERIGHGSTVEVTLCIYPTRQGMGHRLEQIRVLELVPYEPEGGEKDTKEETKDPTSVKTNTSPKPKKGW